MTARRRPVLAFSTASSSSSFIATTDAERELLTLCRAAGEDAAEILRYASVVVADRRLTKLTFEVELLASGTKRTFWNAVRSGYHFVDPEMQAELASVDDVLEAADEFLRSFLDAREWPIAPERSIEARPFCDNHFKHSIRRGDYRVTVNFLPDHMQKAWQARARVAAGA